MIVSLGSINVDIQVRVNRPVALGQVTLGRDYLLEGGGKAANIALLANRLDVPAKLIGRVGDDDFGVIAMQALRSGEVDLDHVTLVSGRPTGVALVIVQEHGDKAIVLAENANAIWTPEDAEDAARALDEAPDGAVLVADLEVPAFVVERVVREARAREFRVVLDPSPADRMTTELLGLVDDLTPNAHEAEQLTGIRIESIEDAMRAGAVLIERGARSVHIKLGGGGCVVVHGDEARLVPTPAVEVVDETGAGDAFAGALAVALLEGRRMTEATRFAVTAASIAVSRYGGQRSMPTREDIHELFIEEPEEQPSAPPG